MRIISHQLAIRSGPVSLWLQNFLFQMNLNTARRITFAASTVPFINHGFVHQHYDGSRPKIWWSIDYLYYELKTAVNYSQPKNKFFNSV